MHGASRWIVYSLFTMLSIVPGLPQESSATQDNLYSMALVAGATEMQRKTGHIDDSYLGGIRTDYQHLIVRKNPEITDDLPSQSHELHFEYLDDASLIAKYNKVKKGFSILEVHPIHGSGSTLKIHIAQNWVRSEHRRLMIGISDWADVEIRYDCQKQAFVIADVKLGGI